MKIANKRNALIISLFVLLVGIGSALFYINEFKYKPQTFEVNVNSDYAVSGNVENIVERSEYIVRGKYQKLIENWEMVPSYVSEVYSFNVEQSLLGDLDGEIQIAIPKYEVVQHSIEDNAYSANLELPYFDSIEFDKDYVLFLTRSQLRDFLFPANVPFQVSIDDSSVSTLEYKASSIAEVKSLNNDKIIFKRDFSNIQSIDKITGLNEEQLIDQINSAIKQRKTDK